MATTITSYIQKTKLYEEKLLEIYKQDSDFKNENELVVDKLDKIIDLLELISKKG